MKGLKRGMLTLATVTGIAMLTSVQVDAAEINENKENYERLLRPIFDGEWYASNYPDVVKVYGTDDDALFDHFMTFGITEGRDINAVFDVEKYKEANPDLAEQFGDDYAAYYEHYVTYGKAEQRPLQIEGNNSSDDYMLLNEQKSNDSLDDELEAYMEYQRLAREKGIEKFIDNQKKKNVEFYDECNKVRDYLKTQPDIDISGEVHFDQKTFDSYLAEYKAKIADFDNAYNAYKEYAETNLYDLNDVKNQIGAAKQDGASKEQIEHAKQAAENTYNSIVIKHDMLNESKNKMDATSYSGSKLSSMMYDNHRNITDAVQGSIYWTYLPEFDEYEAKMEILNELDVLLSLYDESSFWDLEKIHTYLEDVDPESKDYEYINGLSESFEYWGSGYGRAKSDWDGVGLRRSYNSAKGYITDLYDTYNEYGAIIEKYSDRAKEDRMAFESLSETKVLVKLRDDFSAQLDESVVNSYKRSEEKSKVVAEVNEYCDGFIEKYYRNNISEEDEKFVSSHEVDSDTKKKELEQLLSKNASELDMATFLKNEADSLVYNENGENTDPGTPGEVVNPEDPGTSGEVVNPEDPGTSGEVVNPEDPGTSGEVVNPEDPGTSGEVVNPEDPGTSGEVVNPEDPGTSGEVVNPEKPGKPSVTISVNGNITITVVDDHTISVDFDGHIEAQCAG